jgi:hypothetical protein
MRVVHTNQCVGDLETLRTVVRQTFVRRDPNGLTEVLQEAEGELGVRTFYNDAGELVHTTGPASGRTMTATADLIYQPLTQGWRVPFTMSLAKALPSEQLRELPPAARDAALRGWFQYLGQTDFDARRVAGYRTTMAVDRLSIEPGTSMTVRMDAFGYHEVKQGIPLFVQLVMDFEGVFEGQSVQVRMTCQMTFDRAASAGVP